MGIHSKVIIMRWGMGRINGVIVKGKDLKSLIHRPSGVLVYKDNELVFVGGDDPIKLVLPHLPQKAEEKVVFISDEFESVKKLSDNDDYLVIFKNDSLEVWDKRYTELKLLLYGIVI
jgi:hypothetical protein